MSRSIPKVCLLSMFGALMIPFREPQPPIFFLPSFRVRRKVRGTRVLRDRPTTLKFGKKFFARGMVDLD